MELNVLDFDNLRNFIKENIGLSLADEKAYLIKQRLEPLVHEYHCRSFTDFYLKLIQQSDRILENKIIEAITTNETVFFRDNHPFDQFVNHLLPVLFKRVRERKAQQFTRRGAKVRIWSAAASTGQEPYSIAISIAESLIQKGVPGIDKNDFSILASDISSSVLAKAIAGNYTQMQMERGMPFHLQGRYFHQEGDNWVINEDIQQMVEFKRINLVKPFMFAGSFDMIFCRNVLIYFDIHARKKILEQFYQLLNPDGFLVLGASENVYGITDKFESNHFGPTIVYKRKKKTPNLEKEIVL